MKRRGIILAGGSGTRLFPATTVVSKQLLPVYDKPMIYYPLTTLMLADIREILIISTPRDLPLFEELCGSGEQWGLRIEYAIQPQPEGLAQALIIAENFLDSRPSALILGDNIFFGNLLHQKLAEASKFTDGATIFSYRVKDPERYGVAEFTPDGKVLSLEEKPDDPKSNHAVTGLYFYDQHAPAYARKLTSSSRGELEITDLNKVYLALGKLRVEQMNRGYAWLDTGTHESLIDAHQFVQIVERRQGLKIACPEEIAYRKKWIAEAQIVNTAKQMLSSGYGQYLMQIVDEINNEID